jgi:hypothetical protein
LCWRSQRLERAFSERVVALVWRAHPAIWPTEFDEPAKK